MMRWTTKRNVTDESASELTAYGKRRGGRGEEIGDLAAYFRAVIDGKNEDEAARLAAEAIADRKAGKG
jgi:hypothetical protein